MINPVRQSGATRGVLLCVPGGVQSRRMRFAKWLGGAVWIGSWYLMFLEITRWHHVKPSLAFNSDPIPGTGIRPRPGMPLILLYIACVAAPLVVVAGLGHADPRASSRRIRP
jgi:hypothetical protein